METRADERTRTGPGGPGPSPGSSTPTDSRQKDEVYELADQAKQAATETASGAGTMVRQRIDDQYHKLSTRLDEMVNNLNKAADTLDEQGSPGAKNLVHSATRQMERVSGYMSRTSADDVLSDADRYAKQHPWAVIAGGIIVGLAASRFLKMAMPERSEGGTTYHAAV